MDAFSGIEFFSPFLQEITRRKGKVIRILSRDSFLVKSKGGFPFE
jgi:hypothetical protein